MPKLDPDELRKAGDEASKQGALAEDPLEQIRGALAAKHAYEAADAIEKQAKERGR